MRRCGFRRTRGRQDSIHVCGHRSKSKCWRTGGDAAWWGMLGPRRLLHCWFPPAFVGVHGSCAIINRARGADECL
eukprot:7201991-Prymnesium_polylepis.1